MSIERQEIKLRPIELVKTDKNIKVRLKNEPSNEVLFPLKVEKILYLLMEGISLKDLIIRLHFSGRKITFRALYKLLEKLSDNKLISNKSINEYINRLRPHYEWRRSLLHQSLFKVDLLNFKRGVSDLFFAHVLLIITFLFGGVSVFNFVKESPLVLHSFNQTSHFWSAFISLIFVFSVVRSLKSVFKLILIRGFSGSAVSLFLEVTPFSVHLLTQGLVFSVKKSWSEWFSVICLFFLTFSGPLLAQLFGFSDVFIGYCVFSTVILVLSDWSPLVFSDLTDGLSYLYNLWDENFFKLKNKMIEQRIASIHVFFNFLWVLLFGLFLVFSFLYLFDDKFSLLFSSHRMIQLSWGVFFVSILFCGIVFIDDMLNVFAYGSDVDRAFIKNIWRKPGENESDGISALQSGSVDREVIAKLPLLRNVEPEVKIKLLNNASLIRVSRKVRICRQGSHNRDLFIVVSGSVGVYRTTRLAKREFVTSLEKGAVFGEFGFFMNQPRTADVIAIEESVLLKIVYNSEDFSYAIDKKMMDFLKERIWFLQALVSSTMFKTIPQEAMDSILFKGKILKIPQNMRIINQGDVGEKAYFIIQGEADVLKNFHHVNRMKKGDLFGEIALLLPNQPRTASVIAATELLVVELSYNDFWDVLSDNLSLAMQIEDQAMQLLYGEKDKNKN